MGRTNRQGTPRRRWSVAASWAVSYILILLIPIVSAVISSYYTSSVIKREIQDANHLVLGNLQSQIDRLMEDERSIYAFLYTNQQLASLAQGREKGADFYFSVSEFAKLLYAYSLSKPGVDILIYMRDQDYILSSKTCNESRFIYGSKELTDPDFPDYDRWKAALSGSYNSRFLVSWSLNIAGSENSLVYANSVKFSGSSAVNIFVSVPFGAIAELTGRLEESVLLLTNERGEPAAAFDRNGEAALPQAESSPPDGQGIYRAGGVRFISTAAHSAQSGWQFAVLTPEKTFWKQAKYSAVLNIASLLVALVLGLLSAYLLLRRNYQPVSRILQLMGGAQKGENEFERIRRVYSSLSDENRSMKNVLQKSEQALRESYLLSRLKGRRSQLPKEEAYARFALEFGEDAFGLTAVSAAPCDSAEDADELAIFAVNNVFSEMMEQYHFYKVEDGQMLYYLFQLAPGERDGWEEHCCKCAQDLCELFSDKLNTLLTVSISRTEDSFERVHSLYREAMDAIEYQSIVGGSGVIRSIEVQEPGEQMQARREELNQSLFEAVGEGNAPKAHEAVQELLRVCDRAAVPFQALRFMMLDSLNAVLDAFSSAVEDSGMRFQLMNQMEHLMASPDERDFQEKLLTMLTYACHSIRALEEKETPELSGRVSGYVQEHYSDSALNISAIAEALGRTPKYLSRVFKAETGEGLLDYINRVRIRRAKEILNEREITCEELAVLVGYTNSRTFRRAFTKLEGVTPGKYSDHLKNAEED